MCKLLASRWWHILTLHAAVCLADDKYEKCPDYPDTVPASEIVRDAEIRMALSKVDRLLANVAAKLPSGLIATVVYDQETIFSKGYGRRDAFNASSGPPDEHNLVRVASITKVFTDILLYQLRDSGTVALDDPLTKYIPKFRLRHSSAKGTKGTVTLRNLASHTSGLPREVPYPCSFIGKCGEDEVLDRLSTMLPVMPPARRFHYSNLGIALLGRALGHAKGSSAAMYESLVESQILEPLGMIDASFQFDRKTKQKMAVGTSTKGAPLNFSEVCAPNSAGVSWDSPCGCLWASARDIGELMKLLFRDNLPADGKRQILDGDSIHEMLSPAVLLRDGSSAIGMPWEMKYSSGVWMKSKQGELPGYRSSLSIVEPLKLGIFVSALVTDVDELSVWTVPALDILVDPLIKTLRRKATPPVLPPNYEIYSGLYSDGSVRVVVAGTTLQLNLGKQQPLNLTSVRGVEHILRAHPAKSTAGCRWLDDSQDQELVYFEVANGRAHSLYFMDAKYNRVLGRPSSQLELV